jgi:hypothetical protein
MKLIDFIERMDSVDEELIIFQENRDDFNSDIIVSKGKEGDGGIKIENDKKYYYLIEVFLAKEFIADWIQSLDYSPGQAEIAKRLYDYSMNDA